MSVPAVLLLENGRVFRGRSVGPQIESIGEVVFNTSLSGYQEILSDPSYAGQIIVMTAPQIGNTGVNEADMEANALACAGLVVREASPLASNWRSQSSLPSFLDKHQRPAIEGVDTRALTRALRDEGAMRGAISTQVDDIEGLLARIKGSRSMEGLDLASTVTCSSTYVWEEPLPDGPAPASEFEVVAYDFGIKRYILRNLQRAGCRVTVVPASTPASEVLARKPDGVFLSNGPGDPAAVGYAIETVRELAGSGVPLFGICLGHQILALAFGARTYKLPFGHHGGNHPVMELATRKVEITAQNHGFAVDAASLPDELRMTHVNLYDQTVAGLQVAGKPVFSVQYHPEAGPGPHDSAYLFQRFIDAMRQAA